MDEQLQQLLAALGVQTFAEGLVAISNGDRLFAALKKESGKDSVAEAVTELCARAARAPFASAVEKATGKQGDEAIGLIVAALASHAALPEAREQLANLQKTTDTQSFESLVTKAKAENKLTKAQEDAYRASFAAGELTLKQVEFVFANLTVIAALESKDHAAPSGITPSADLKHNGKTFAEMKPRERADLKAEHPDLYEAMRKGAGL